MNINDLYYDPCPSMYSVLWDYCLENDFIISQNATYRYYTPGSCSNLMSTFSSSGCAKPEDGIRDSASRRAAYSNLHYSSCASRQYWGSLSGNYNTTSMRHRPEIYKHKI